MNAQQNATIEQVIAAMFGTPSFTSSVGDPFQSKDPSGAGGKEWTGRRVATATVPLRFNGTDSGMTFTATVYRDISPDGESYAVRASLPTGASKYTSSFGGDEQLVSALKCHIAEHADLWLEQVAKTARASSAAVANQPRLIIRKVAKPEAAPVPAPPAPEAPATVEAAPVVQAPAEAPATTTTPAPAQNAKPTGNTRK